MSSLGQSRFFSILLSAVAVPLLGLPAPRVAAALGITQMPVLRGIARGRELLAARALDPERLAREAMRRRCFVAATPPTPRPAVDNTEVGFKGQYRCSRCYVVPIPPGPAAAGSGRRSRPGKIKRWTPRGVRYLFTTNRVFGGWNQIFADGAMAHAILGRLAERAEVFHLEGTSYRETHRRPAPKVTPA